MRVVNGGVKLVGRCENHRDVGGELTLERIYAEEGSRSGGGGGER